MVTATLTANEKRQQTRKQHREELAIMCQVLDWNRNSINDLAAGKITLKEITENENWGDYFTERKMFLTLDRAIRNKNNLLVDFILQQNKRKFELIRGDADYPFEKWIEKVGGKVAVDLFTEIIVSWEHMNLTRRICDGEIQPDEVWIRMINSSRKNLERLSKEFQDQIKG